MIITGATSGIGYALAKQLALRGETVIAFGRNKKKCKIAQQSISVLKENLDITYLNADLSSFQEIDEACKKINILTNNKGIDVLINNASTVEKWYLTTKQGYEMQFQVNHLSGVLITLRLMKRLKK